MRPSSFLIVYVILLFFNVLTAGVLIPGCCR